MSLVFWKWNSTVFFVLSILLQKSGKRCAPFFAYLNFNNKSGTESRFILLYLNFHKTLVFDTKTEMWSVCSMLKLYQTRVKQSQDSFYHTYIFITHWYLSDHVSGFWKLNRDVICFFHTLSMKVKQKCDSFFPYLNSINESGTESRFILPYLNFYKSLIPYRIMCMVL
jgi:hypothetical protein